MDAADKNDLSVLSRHDVFLIADIGRTVVDTLETTIYAVPKKATGFATSDGFRASDLNSHVRAYKDTNGVMHAGRERWGYVSYTDKQSKNEKCWVRLETDFINNGDLVHSHGLPQKTVYTHGGFLNDEEAIITNVIPTFGSLFVRSIDFEFNNLPSHYAVKNMRAHMTPHGHVYWLNFPEQNEPKYNLSSIVYGGETNSDLKKPRNRLVTIPKDASLANEEDGSLGRILSSEEAAPIWDKLDLEQFGRNLSEICADLNIPDLSLLYKNPQPLIVQTIEDLGLDGVTGEKTIVFQPTYRRLGIENPLA